MRVGKVEITGGSPMSSDGGVVIVTGSLRPYRSGSYLNFEEGEVDAQVFFDADTWRLLRALRTHWDPNSLFLANHEIKES